METKFIAAQALSTGLIGPWLALGVRDNILHHSVNETYTAAVFEMTRMRQEYPENYTQVSPRAVTDRHLQNGPSARWSRWNCSPHSSCLPGQSPSS